jgi:hypothetical protein
MTNTIRPKKNYMCVSDCMIFKIRVGRSGFFFYKPTSIFLPLKSHKLVSSLLQLINYLTCSTMFLVPNIDQMYKEMKKIQTGNRSIVEVGNKHEFSGFCRPIFLGHKNVRGRLVDRKHTHTYFFFGLTFPILANTVFLIAQIPHRPFFLSLVPFGFAVL